MDSHPPEGKGSPGSLCVWNSLIHRIEWSVSWGIFTLYNKYSVLHILWCQVWCRRFATPLKDFSDQEMDEYLVRVVFASTLSLI